MEEKMKNGQAHLIFPLGCAASLGQDDELVFGIIAQHSSVLKRDPLFV